MNPAWILAFPVAGTVVLIATPLLRRLALRIDLVDRPAARKIHAVPVPYLGGVAIAFGVLAGLAVVPGLGWQPAVVVAGAALVAAAGLLDDDRQLRASTRLAVETLAALAVVATGLRFEATGAGIVDAGITLIWIVGITNALNLLDNMDGLGAGVAAAIAGSTLVLAVPGGEPWVAALAAAVAGASLAFLAFNVRPARVFMGDAGSLFLGYLLAVVTLAATQPLPSRPGVVVPLLLCAVPIADTATVVVGRLRHGLSVARGGRDHLSHRLVGRGLSPGPAVALLAVLSVSVGLLGAVAGNGDLSLAGAVATGMILLGLVLAWALHGDLYQAPVVGLSGQLRLGTGLLMVLCAVAVATGIGPIGADNGLVKPSTAVASIDNGALRNVTTAEQSLVDSSSLSDAPLGLVGAAIAGLGVVLGVVVWQRRHLGELILPDDEVDVRDEQLSASSPDVKQKFPS